MRSIERKQTTPGEILKEEFLTPLHLTQKELAHHMDCDIKVINRIVNNKSSVTAEIAIKLADTFGTTPDFWLNAQHAVDIYKASKNIAVHPAPLI